MKILYHGASWPPNIGNAFIDYGSIHTIKKAMPNARVYFASSIPRWLFLVNQDEPDKAIDLAELMEVDTAVFSGMLFCDEFIRNEGPVIKKLSDRGVRIIFNGCGCATYDTEEKNHFQKYLKSINASGFISRDELAYQNFKDCFPKSYNGIDCGFFLSEAFESAALTIKDYVVYNFDLMEEPQIKTDKRIIRSHHSWDQLFPCNTTQPQDSLVVGAKRPFIRRIKQSLQNGYLKQKDVVMSDIPEDYLNLYANAYAVYSDRVHACVATLSFGNLAKLYSTTPRAGLFERVGAGELKQELTRLDQEKLRIEKGNQVSFLREILK